MKEKGYSVSRQQLFCKALNKSVLYPLHPKRIVSLVPSQTELLHDLGLEKEVVGITKFCIHPDKWFRNKQRVGGTKKIDIEKIRLLQPDLIIANKEENIKEEVEALETVAPVYVTDVDTLDDALQMIETIGLLTGRTENASFIKANIENAFSVLPANNPLLAACYLIWREPYMTVGGDTFINDMMKKCGLRNIFENSTRYPATSIQQIAAYNPEVVLLSSEPYPFKQQHIDELEAYMPNTRFLLVDGEMFSWYGSRLLQSPEYFRQLAALL